MDFPEIAILIITYKRYKELRQTVTALQSLITYPADKIHWIITDDCTPGNKLDRLKSLKSHEDIDHIQTYERAGWGANANTGLYHVAHSPAYQNVDYVFQIEDDYVLQEPLDLRLGVALLEARQNIGMLRYRGTGGDRFIYHQFHCEIPLLPDYKEGQGASAGHVTYLQIDNASPTAWIYSNGAHLKRVRTSRDGYKSFHEHYGAYPEGLKLGNTELKYAMHVKDGMKVDNAPAIAILPHWIPMRFEHIGHSWQHSTDDIGS